MADKRYMALAADRYDGETLIVLERGKTYFLPEGAELERLKNAGAIDQQDEPKPEKPKKGGE
jgi:hypothetical protein